MFNLNNLASKLSEEKDQKDLWLKSLTNARICHQINKVQDKQLEQLALSCKNPSQFNFFSRITYLHNKICPHQETALSLLQKSVNNSWFDYSDWLDAIEYFYSWLELNNSHGHLTDILSYINCINELEGKNTHPNLIYLLSEMLSTFGFERKKQREVNSPMFLIN